MRRKTKKVMSKVIIGVTISVAIFSILLLVGAFYFFVGAPLKGKVVQDQPLMIKLCEMQFNCQVRNSPYKCSSKGILLENSIDELLKANNFNGCNVSTDTYFMEGDKGYVYVDSCSCGGIQ